MTSIYFLMTSRYLESFRPLWSFHVFSMAPGGHFTWIYTGLASIPRAVNVVVKDSMNKHHKPLDVHVLDGPVGAMKRSLALRRASVKSIRGEGETACLPMEGLGVPGALLDHLPSCKLWAQSGWAWVGTMPDSKHREKILEVLKAGIC